MFDTILAAIFTVLILGIFLFGCFVYIWNDITSARHYTEWTRRINRGEINCEPEWPKFPHFK